MKNSIILYLQKLLGYKNYLFVFSLFKIAILKLDKAENEFLHFLKMIPDGGIVLDIGANIGLMTVSFAKNLANTLVVAFEPIPTNSEILKKVVEFHAANNVRILPIALGNREAQIEMIVPVIDSVKKQGLSRVSEVASGNYANGDKYLVSMKTLDQIEFPERKKITAIKMDVENFEYYVLSGGLTLIKKHMPIIYCELQPNENRGKSIQLLTEIGYETFVLNRNSEKLELYDASRHAQQNFFFVPKA